MLKTLRRLTCALLILAVSPAPMAHAEPSEGQKQLLKNIAYWKAKGREDKVLQLWRKVLKNDKTNARALIELSIYEARAGRKKEAQAYFQQLKTAHPNHPELPAVQRMISMGGRYESVLVEARQDVREKKYTAAISKYKKVFGDTIPTGSLGIEYYTTLGGMDQGWEEARKGLKRLAEANPNEPTYELHYAKHLTYRPKTIREGIDRLSKLVDKPSVSKEATKAWLQALEWLRATPADRKLYDKFIARHKKDPRYRDKVAAMKKRIPNRKVYSAGDRAFRKGDMEKAKELYLKDLRRNKKSINARLGLASIAMKKGKFADARKVVLEVRRLAPKRSSLWRPFLRKIDFWMFMEKAKKALARGKYDLALSHVASAKKKLRSGARHADTLRGHIVRSQGKLEEAAAIYEAVLKRYPKHVDALRALAEIRLEQKRFDEAEQLNARLAKVMASKQLGKEQIAAHKLRTAAAVASKAGDLDKAAKLLEEAIKNMPKDQWLWLELMGIQLQQNKPIEARATLKRLLEIAPDLPEAKVAEARLLAAEGKLAQALELLKKLKDARLKAGAEMLRKTLEVRLATARIVRDAQGRCSTMGNAELEKLEKSLSDSPELLVYVAQTWSEIGLYTRALRLIRQQMGKAKGRTQTTLKLQKATALLRAERLGDLEEEIQELESENLKDGQAKELESLRIGLAVRNADRARDDGYPHKGFAYLNPMLKAHPKDPVLMAALGRLFLASKSPEEAYAVFAWQLKRDNKDLGARKGAIQAALDMGNEKLARKLIKSGRRVHRDDPRVELMAANLERSLGNHEQALALLAKAERMLDKIDPPRSPADSPEALSVDSDYESIVQVANHKLGAGQEVATSCGGATPRTMREKVDKETLAVRALFSPDVATLPFFRVRSGEPGLGMLLNFEVPVSASLATGYHGRLRLGARLVVVSAGELDMGDPDMGGRFGTLGTRDIDPNEEPESQDQVGGALEAAWSYKGLTLAFGTSPLGFPLYTFLGGAQYNNRFDKFGVSIGAGRRLLRESVLSYSGTYDPVTNQAWGQITANGGRVAFSFHHSVMTYYLYGGFDWLMGTHVENNHKGYGGLGLNWLVHDTTDLEVKTGFGLGLMGYGNNLRYFTLGHGGYFSPQIFVSAAVPVIVEGSDDRIAYSVHADLGINWFREDEAPYYPLDAQHQTARSLLQPTVTGQTIETMYPGQNTVSFAINLKARMAYKVADQILVGGEVRGHYAADYAELFGGVFLAYSFRALSNPTLPSWQQLDF